MNQPSLPTPLTAAEQLTVIGTCLRNDKLTAAADACDAGVLRIAELEADRAALLTALTVIVEEAINGTCTAEQSIEYIKLRARQALSSVQS